MEPFIVSKRTLTYTGPVKWVRMCAERALVRLDREIGGGKSITSEWHCPVLQSIAVESTTQAYVCEQLREQRDALLAALKEVEWSYHGTCPQCGGGTGHQPKCVVGNAIAKGEERC